MRPGRPGPEDHRHPGPVARARRRRREHRLRPRLAGARHLTTGPARSGPSSPTRCASWSRRSPTAGTPHWTRWASTSSPDGAPAQDWVRPVTPEEVYAYARPITLQAIGHAADRVHGHGAAPGHGRRARRRRRGRPRRGERPSVAAAGQQRMGHRLGAQRRRRRHAAGQPALPVGGRAAVLGGAPHRSRASSTSTGHSCSGLPGVAIGFTEDMAWTHTVSAGNRFTAYRSTWCPGSRPPTSTTATSGPMTSRDVTVEVLQPDGSITTDDPHAVVQRTTARSSTSPASAGATRPTITYRDANIDNDEFLAQYLAMIRAEDLDDFQAAHEDVPGRAAVQHRRRRAPTGTAWYADTSATPNLSEEAIDRLRGARWPPTRSSSSRQRAGPCSWTGPTSRLRVGRRARRP